MLYVSRAGDKLAEAAKLFRVDFRGKTVLDIGSSTGGFTDFALQNGAAKVICIEKGTDQLSRSLHSDPRIELHEKTDIFNFPSPLRSDMILIDVSFVSLLKVLNHVQKNLASPDTLILAMLKPQFEAKSHELVNGRIKNSKIRREIIKNFESQIKPYFAILNKHDNSLKGREQNNQERFYLLNLIR